MTTSNDVAVVAIPKKFLVNYDAACAAVARCYRIDEVRDIADKAMALAVYARKVGDAALEADTSALRVKALYRLGVISKGLPTAPVVDNLPQRPKSGTLAKRLVLKQAGISKSLANRAEMIASIKITKFEKYIEKKRTKRRACTVDEVLRMVSKPARRAKRVAQIRKKTAALPTKRYNVFYADPPWRYDAALTESRRPENQYPTMALADIKSLEDGNGRSVQDIVAADAILFLWAIPAMLTEALDVMASWGFEYVTSMIWVKPSIGPGQWVRMQHEMLLIGVRGDMPVPLEANRPSSIIHAPRLRHSQKPPFMYDVIDKMYPDLERIELFARNAHEGWDSWGLEAPSAQAAE